MIPTRKPLLAISFAISTPHTGFSYTALATHHTDDMTDFIMFIILDAAAVSLLAAGSLLGHELQLLIFSSPYIICITYLIFTSFRIVFQCFRFTFSRNGW